MVDRSVDAINEKLAKCVVVNEQNSEVNMLDPMEKKKLVRMNKT